MSSKSVAAAFAGIAGGGLETSSLVGSDGVDAIFGASVGPGPGMLTLVAGAAEARVSGMSTAREWALSAGVSVKALPEALRMNVCARVSVVIIADEMRTDLWVLVVDASKGARVQQQLI